MSERKYQISMARIRKIRLNKAGDDFVYWASLFGKSLKTVYKWESPSAYNRSVPGNPEILLMLKMENQIEEEGMK